jgi:RNA polymerase sigma factor (sigma-70 family)
MGNESLPTVSPYLDVLFAAQVPDTVRDRDLLARFVKDRDAKAFAALVHRHSPMVLGVCRRVLRNLHDAEDVCQATFLILAQKGTTIRAHGSLAGWLHRVAYRLAQDLRTRRQRQSAAPLAAEEIAARPEPAADPTWQEVRAALDEELERLPERYRAPLVLCYLDGRTRDEAARQLGWSLNVLRGRLERGRDLLRRRLTRRGLALSAALLAEPLKPSEAAARLSVALRVQTVRQAQQLAAEASLAAAEVAPTVATLIDRGLQGMGTFKKLSLVALAVAGLLGGGTLAFFRPVNLAADAPAEQQQAKASPRTDCYGDPLPPGAIARLGTVRWRHENGVGAAIFTPDGKTLISGAKQSVRLWNAASGQAAGKLTGDLQWVWGLTVSGDGKTLAAGGAPGINLWDRATGQLLRGWHAHNFWVARLVFSPDDKVLASVGDDSGVRLWDWTTGTELRALEGHKGLVNCLAYTPDGRTLVSGGDDGTVRLWETATGKERHCFGEPRLPPSAAKSHNGRRWFDGQVSAVAVSPDSRFVAAMYFNGPVRLRELATGKEVRTFNFQGGMGGLAFSPDGRLLAGGSWGQPTCLWDVTTGQVRHELKSDAAGHVAFSPDGRTLATWPHDHAIRLWDVATGKPRPAPQAGTGAVLAVAFSPDGRQVASGGWWDPQLRLWDAATGKEQAALTAKPISQPFLAGVFNPTPRRGNVTAVTYSPDGQTLAFTGNDGHIHLCRTANRQERLAFPTHQRSVSVLAFSADGKRLASGGDDGTIVLWDPASGKEERRLRGHKNRIVTLAFSPDGKRLASGCESVRIWDVATGKQLARFPDAQLCIMSLAISPDGRTLAIAESGESFVRLCDAATGKELRRIEGLEPYVNAVAFAPDGRTLGAACVDGSVRLIETATGKERRRFLGHQGEATAVAFSRDGRRLASASWDTTILIWDVTGRAAPPPQPAVAPD